MAALFFCTGSVLDYQAGYIKLMHIFYSHIDWYVLFISVGFFLKKNLTLCIWLKINSHLFAMQEQLDAAGVELPRLYKSIESQVPDVCETEAWKRRAHWAGSQVPEEANLSIKKADEYLQSCRPARR